MAAAGGTQAFEAIGYKTLSIKNVGLTYADPL